MLVFFAFHYMHVPIRAQHFQNLVKGTAAVDTTGIDPHLPQQIKILSVLKQKKTLPQNCSPQICGKRWGDRTPTPPSDRVQ